MGQTSDTFRDRVVIVTGGASGIGEATVHRFAAGGAHVVLVDVNAEGAERVAKDVAAAERPGDVSVVVADIATPEGITHMVDEAVRLFDRLDVVVNNAVAAEMGPVLGISEDGWQRTFDAGPTAVWRSARAAVPVMARNGGGAFVNISSNAALAAVPGLGAYGSAKAGIIHITRQIAVECADQGIRANSITPGIVQSPGIVWMLSQLDRERVEFDMVRGFGEPAQLAAVIAFLASDDSSFVNGENIKVDGGWFAKRLPGGPGGLTFGMP
jgi:NAD(P)-dependent dehydrogenase (short-subunit alcohol dehydrogenase family)